MESRDSTIPPYECFDLDPLPYKLVVIPIRADVDHPEDLVRTLTERIDAKLVQVVDAQWIVGAKHLRAAVVETLLGDISGSTWIKNPSLRLLAYLSLERQVVEAIAKTGVKRGSQLRLVLCAVVQDESVANEVLSAVATSKIASVDPSGFREMEPEAIDRVAERFEIRLDILGEVPAEERVGALTDFLIERMALLPYRS